jgi:hypothetical protein
MVCGLQVVVVIGLASVSTDVIYQHRSRLWSGAICQRLRMTLGFFGVGNSFPDGPDRARDAMASAVITTANQADPS